MKDIQERFGTSIILITHDLGFVASMCDRVVVMKDGGIVETGTTEEIFYSPKHSYTKSLLSAIPIPDPKIESKKNERLCKNKSRKTNISYRNLS